jgi:hypothetical protein
MWAVLNPMLKLEWFKTIKKSHQIEDVKKLLFQAVSAFNIVKLLYN